MKISGNFCFLRQLHLHPAVTYVYVSSLGCKYSFLGLQAFSTLCQSVDFVNILPRSPRGRFARKQKLPLTDWTVPQATDREIKGPS